MDNEGKKSKKSNLILLESIKGIVKLSEDEEELKDKLIEIEDKLNSFENIINKIEEETFDSIYASSSFGNLVGSIAIAKAMEVIEDYFELKKKEK